MTAAVSQAQFAAALFDPALPCPPGLVAWNGSDPAQRLAVYRNNVMASLIDALAQTFPVVEQLVGRDFFRAMASRHVRQSPPASRVLAAWGQDFADFIARFEPARGVPYLADVARLERLRVDAYHAADAAPLAAAEWQRLLTRGEAIRELRLQCHASVGVLRSAFAVVSIWRAHPGPAPLAAVDVDAPQDALVLRDGLEVQVLVLDAGAAVFIDALRDGMPMGAAADAAIDRCPAFDLAGCLGLVMRHGALVGAHLPPEDPR